MKRREFIVGSAGIATGMVSLRVGAQSPPCPPPVLDVDGGTSAETSCIISSPTDAEADWQQRISGRGVVWYHDFRRAAEVDRFRWRTGTGNDPQDRAFPNTCRWQESDGITGGCLEMFRPAGTTEPPEWWRPFVPLDAESTGRGEADPAANGSLTVRSFQPVQGRGTLQNDFNALGYYGHESHHAEHSGAFDGTEYYLQMRVKIDSRRMSGPEGGKLVFLATTVGANNTQIVIISKKTHSNMPGRNLFYPFRNGSPPLDGDDPGMEQQVGSDLGYCRWSSPNVDTSGCWAWPLDEWVTAMYHVRPGPDGQRATVFRTWVARAGEKSYTKIWDQDNVNLVYENPRKGQNALLLTAFTNNLSSSTDFYHRYCQVIFSREFIPCPQV